MTIISQKAYQDGFNKVSPDPNIIVHEPSSGKKKKIKKSRIIYGEIMDKYKRVLTGTGQGFLNPYLEKDLIYDLVREIPKTGNVLEKGSIEESPFYAALAKRRQLASLCEVCENMFLGASYKKTETNEALEYCFTDVPRFPQVRIARLNLFKIADFQETWPALAETDFVSQWQVLKFSQDNFTLNILLKGKMREGLLIPLARYDTRIPSETKSEYSHVFNYRFYPGSEHKPPRMILRYHDVCSSRGSLEAGIQRAIIKYGGGK